MELHFEELSFEKAVRLFEEWGFLVEQGPGPEEITLIVDGPAHRSHHVYEAAHLAQMAAAVLRARWRNGVALGRGACDLS